MQITRNEDGTVTVRIAKSDEEYDPADGGLYVSETLSKADYEKAVSAASKAKAKPKSDS